MRKGETGQVKSMYEFSMHVYGCTYLALFDIWGKDKFRPFKSMYEFSMYAYGCTYLALFDNWERIYWAS